MTARNESIVVIIGTLVLIALCILIGTVYGAKAQYQPGHPPQDMLIHEQFYATWMEPDNRAVSCCHKQDCAPAESRLEDGHWMARKVGDEGKFTSIPDRKVEHDRDTPDGRSHLCGRADPWNSGKLDVFCFIAGAGG